MHSPNSGPKGGRSAIATDRLNVADAPVEIEIALKVIEAEESVIGPGRSLYALCEAIANPKE